MPTVGVGVGAGRKARATVLLRISGLEDTGGRGFSEHRRYEEEGAWCRSGTQREKHI